MKQTKDSNSYINNIGMRIANTIKKALTCEEKENENRDRE